MKKLTLWVLMFCCAGLFLQCRDPKQHPLDTEQTNTTESPENPERSGEIAPDVQDGGDKPKPAEDIPSDWQELTENEGYQVDIRYATKNNFTKQKIYDCGRCFLRPEAAQKLDNIRQELEEEYGYGIKLFDCFRPRPYQQKLWDIVPDPDYVTPPQKGSMHSRGLAVDLTLTDQDGRELDMGTPFDFFGKEAHHAYTDLPDQVLKNRALLKNVMEKYGFRAITTEWWHYSLNISYPLDNWLWPCEQ